MEKEKPKKIFKSDVIIFSILIAILITGIFLAIFARNNAMLTIGIIMSIVSFILVVIAIGTKILGEVPWL